MTANNSTQYFREASNKTPMVLVLGWINLGGLFIVTRNSYLKKRPNKMSGTIQACAFCGFQSESKAYGSQ